MKHALLLICCLSIHTAAQVVKYDKFADFTFIRTDQMPLKPEGEVAILYGNPIVYFSCGFQGQTPPVNPDIVPFSLNFRFRTSSWRFLDTHDLILLLDGKRTPLGPGKRDGSITTGGVVESLSYTVKYDAFKPIAAAKKVELQIRSFETTLDADTQAQMNKMLTACVSPSK